MWCDAVCAEEATNAAMGSKDNRLGCRNQDAEKEVGDPTVLRSVESEYQNQKIDVESQALMISKSTFPIPNRDTIPK